MRLPFLSHAKPARDLGGPARHKFGFTVHAPGETAKESANSGSLGHVWVVPRQDRHRISEGRGKRQEAEDLLGGLFCENVLPTAQIGASEICFSIRPVGKRLKEMLPKIF